MTDKPKSKKPRVVKTLVPLPRGSVPVYFGARIAHAFHEVTADMTLYKGVRLGELLQALYDQGKKDGARQVKDSFENMMKQIPHNNPGQPKKKNANVRFTRSARNCPAPRDLKRSGI